jgi:hypothetical protein
MCSTGDVGIGLAYAASDHLRPPVNRGGAMGRILLGVIIGVILVVWLLVSCVGAIF